jgi:hypothetical protein
MRNGFDIWFVEKDAAVRKLAAEASGGDESAEAHLMHFYWEMVSDGKIKQDYRRTFAIPDSTCLLMDISEDRETARRIGIDPASLRGEERIIYPSGEEEVLTPLERQLRLFNQFRQPRPVMTPDWEIIQPGEDYAPEPECPMSRPE